MRNFKIRIVNGEFWGIDDGTVHIDEVYVGVKAARAAIREFLSDTKEAGLDYTSSDIEMVEIKYEYQTRPTAPGV